MSLSPLSLRGENWLRRIRSELVISFAEDWNVTSCTDIACGCNTFRACDEFRRGLECNQLRRVWLHEGNAYLIKSWRRYFS